MRNHPELSEKEFFAQAETLQLGQDTDHLHSLFIEVKAILNLISRLNSISTTGTEPQHHSTKPDGTGNR
jgi:hypothetical protein